MVYKKFDLTIIIVYRSNMSEQKKNNKLIKLNKQETNGIVNQVSCHTHLLVELLI